MKNILVLLIMLLLSFQFSVKSYNINTFGRIKFRKNFRNKNNFFSLLSSLMSTDSYNNDNNNNKLLKKVRELMSENDLDAIIGKAIIDAL